MGEALHSAASEQTAGGADVTVVVATYNGARYIEEQLVSICEQTTTPRKIVVTDDGSTDDTMARAREVLGRYPIASVVTRNPGDKGYSNNFLHGVREAHSTYVAFCDQDDIWEPTKLARCVDVLERSGALLCAHGAGLIDQEGRPIGTFRQGPSRSRFLAPNATRPWFTFAGFTMVFRTDLLARIDPGRRGKDFYRYHQSLSHDSWLTFLASSFGRTAFIADPLARYRQHDRNVVGARQESLRRRFLLALGPAAHPALNRSAIARRLAAELRGVAAREADDPIGAQATRSASRWMRISAVELARHRLYARPTVGGRGLALAANALRGHYSRSAGGLGLRYLPKDLLIGVLRLGAPKL